MSVDRNGWSQKKVLLKIKKRWKQRWKERLLVQMHWLLKLVKMMMTMRAYQASVDIDKNKTLTVLICCQCM